MELLPCEPTGIGANLNDLGWIVTTSDREAWGGGRRHRPKFLNPDTLIDLYSEARGASVPNVNWFRALVAYRFAIITGFNPSLHRRGKSPDPNWEETALSITPLIDGANELLG